jgi:rhamnogalacturonan endolyase
MKETIYLILFTFISISASALTKQMEYLDRGLVAIKISQGVFLSWRCLGTEDTNTTYTIYRNNVKVNSTPISTCTNYTDPSGTTTSNYKVVAVQNGVEISTDEKSVTPWAQQYKTIQLNRPAGGTTEPNKYGSVGEAATKSFPKGQPYGYSPNDCSVGDLDGDGEYEIIVKWDPSNSQDNSYYGITGKVFLDAYKMDGTQLWRIDLGKNIRAGAHYTQFQVYDYDGDGLAEVVCKTAPGTIDGVGNYVIRNSDSPTTDYRNIDTTQIKGSRMLGTIQTGSEYLTLFNGKTGAALHTIAYNPLRGTVSLWGDDYANRCDRFLACTAYLDGIHPSVVMCRGYYKRTTLVAYDVSNKKLVQRWIYDSGTTNTGAYGQGNHNLSVADVDSDGKDEIIYGSCAINENGTVLYRTGYGHGDAMHLSDMDPDNDGQEVWEVHEDKTSAYGYELHDAKTGRILWGRYAGSDVGRGMAGDVDSRYPGFEMWSTANDSIFTCKGVGITSTKPSSNFRIYWDGDLQDELLDGVRITKWTGSGTTTLLTGSGVSSCNSTKSTPCLSADILGDWREEVIWWTTTDSSQIRIYTTTKASDYRLFTPMHDPVYRLGIAWQNSAYNQPPHLGFYIGGGLGSITLPDITMVKYDSTLTETSQPNVEPTTSIYYAKGLLNIRSSENLSSITVYSIQGLLLYQTDAVQQQEISCTIPKNEPMLIVRLKTASGVSVSKVMNAGY